MAFRKIAHIPLVALAKGAFDSSNGTLVFTKTASKKTASVYQDKQSPINVGEMLKLVAKEYNVSDNPSDYIFEAARAVTAEVPNENGDAFPKDELLRFDHRLGKAIYQTFIMKPHHINHRADNPKTARGVVLDASYNDLSDPLENCPGCNHKTASVEGRDATGVNCVKCGHVVKDEFVELLIAVDTKKDPTFAEGVKKGSLNSLSMGCEAGYTDCSICMNRARSVSQFCTHIRSGNKKKIFKTGSGPKMSFEKCGEVVYTEISRVDQPADPTALQREVFTIMPAAQNDLMRALVASVVKLEQKLSKGAQLVQGDAQDMDSLLGKIEELKETHPELYTELKQVLSPGDGEEGTGDGGDKVPEPMTIDDYAMKHQKKNDQHITSAEMGIKPEEGGLPATIASKVAAAIESDLDTLLAVNSKEKKVATTAFKFAKSYKDLEASVTEKGNVRVFTPKGTLFVVKPEQKPENDEAAHKLATSIMTQIAEDGLVPTALKHKAIMGPKIAQILQFHVEDFAGGREEGDKGPITDQYMGDLPREKPAKDLQDGGETDMQEDGQTKPNKSILDEVDYDHQETPKGKPKKVVDDVNESSLDKHRQKTPNDLLKDVEVDRKDKKPNKKAQMEQPDGELPTVTATMDCDTCGYGKQCVCKTASDATPKSDAMAIGPLGATNPVVISQGIDHAVKQAAKQHVGRLERLYKARLDKVSKDANEKVAAAESAAAGRLLRAMRLAATRQALNLEYSPLKAKMADVLLSELDVDAESYYPGMDARTASTIVEATSADAFGEFVDVLLKRASEFMSMSEEALAAIESDVKNLRTASVEVADESVHEHAREDLRRVAMSGNLVVAPSATNETVSSGNVRDTIRSALGHTKVRRASQALNK